MICDDVQRELDAYIDRELMADTEHAVRVHLERCASCQHRVATRKAIGRLVRAAPYYEAPTRVRSRIFGQVRRTRTVRRAGVWASAAMILLGVAGALSIMQSTGTRRDAIADDVVNGHVRSLMAEHLFDVRSTDSHTVKPWFLGKLDFSPPVIDLSSIGFPLEGGRLDYMAGRTVAALVYRRQQHAINVFIWPEAGNSNGITAQDMRGFHVRHWLQGGMAFWTVSDLNGTELDEFVSALRRS